MKIDQGMAREGEIIELVTRICRLSLDSAEADLESSWDLREILRMEADNRTRTRYLFRPLMGSLSFQGIGDEVILGYMEAHGMITYFQIARRLQGHRRRYGDLCARLTSFEAFKACGYRKGTLTCNNPLMLMGCPVPTHDLLKGVLNVKAYSFFLYIRDVCQGDLIGHFEGIIRNHFRGSADGLWPVRARKDLVEDFTRIFGVGEKLANMTLSTLLLADPENPLWVRVGQAMVAVDSLVHNFLHRTGILKYYQAQHPYGPRCSTRCAMVLDILIGKLDAKALNPSFPRYYPRFVQYAIWHFSSLVGHNICNGVKIDDTKPCSRRDICPVYDLCDHVQLKGE